MHSFSAVLPLVGKLRRFRATARQPSIGRHVIKVL